MSFSVLILGSGSALPTISSNQTSQVIEMGNQLFLMDCGEGTQVELRRNKVKVQKIDHIFISHLHGDHFFGLVGLLSTMHLLGRKKELHIHGPKGLQEIIEIQFRNAGSHLAYPMSFHKVEKGGQLVYEDQKVLISSLPLHHRIPCFGYKFEEKEKPRKLIGEALEKHQIPNYARHELTKGEDFRGEDGRIVANHLLSEEPEPPKAYAYCSDTAYFKKMIPHIESVNLLYHEATFLERDRERADKTFHSTAKDAARVASEAGVDKLLLGHFSNRYKAKDGFLQESRQLFKQSYIAEEGQRFKV
ncbi:MAG: ribonuclease Z [Vicingaceae bacterium]